MNNLYKIEGFTLLEILIAVAISSVLIVGLMFSFWRGSRAWERVEKLTELTNDVEFTDSILSADIENAIKLPQGTGIESFNLSDDKKKITFFSLKRLKDEKIPRVYKVSYKLKEVKDNSNLYNLKRASYRIDSSKNLDYEFDSSEYKGIIDSLYGENVRFRGTLFGGVLKLCDQEEKSDGRIIEKLTLKTEDKKNVVFPAKVIYGFNQP